MLELSLTIDEYRLSRFLGTSRGIAGRLIQTTCCFSSSNWKTPSQ